MYSDICKETHLMKAFRKVKQNKGCPGVDRQSILQFEEHITAHIRELSRLLTERRYAPLPVQRIFIPKANGNKRPLGIPAVRDRVVQQAVLDLIQPILEPLFAEASYGFRPGRSAHIRYREHLREASSRLSLRTCILPSLTERLKEETGNL